MPQRLPIACVAQSFRVLMLRCRVSCTAARKFLICDFRSAPRLIWIAAINHRKAVPFPAVSVRMRFWSGCWNNAVAQGSFATADHHASQAHHAARDTQEHRQLDHVLRFRLQP